MNHTISKGDHHMKTLLRFLQNGKTQFHVAALAKEYLDAHNFTQISDRENLVELAAGRYYLAPFSSIVIPFIKGKRTTQFHESVCNKK
jgi:aspartyl aminopeptidase